ncbi:hypothetical protein IAR55_002966 [Kwoniella newhampshirensis]|uniref:BHLH domain-containing protein n=1 Tax=Kwoniella newhampshirensis TaxID=1651941 RepID=A0AAW0Z0A7_9TREE
MSVATPQASTSHQSPTQTSPNPFDNLDPTLHSAPTLNSLSGTGLGPGESSSSSAVGANPLNEFAQQVLGREDAENLLDFGRSNHSILGEGESFGELLAADRRNERGSMERDDEREDKNGYEHDHHHGDLSIGDDQGLTGLEGEETLGLHSGQGLESAITGNENGSILGALGQRKRKRLGEELALDGEGRPIEPQEYARIKKDSHKEVERRRRENINDGINEIAQLIPGGMEKQGKGTLLKRAAQHISELTEKLARAADELTKQAVETQNWRTEHGHALVRLSEEESRSLRFETSWREAEDRAASSNFELERLKAEVEELKARVEQ